MQNICDIFNIILFVTAVGGMFTGLSLVANRVMRFTLPLWFHVCGMAAYIIPLLAPGLYLIPPEAHSWIGGYYIACAIWSCGIIFFIVYDIAKTAFAHRAICGYRICDDKRISAICTRCAVLVGVKKAPPVCFGTLDDPACVAGVLHPVIILNEDIIKQLTDAELTMVICHEITHIKRGHIILERIFDYICILNWFNPLTWIAKKDFGAHCEIDCDSRVLVSLQNEAAHTEYARAMIRLLELSMFHIGGRERGFSVLGFPLAKRRIELIMNRPKKARKLMITFVLTVLLATVILFSVMLSRGHFYPYPAYDTGTEYSYVEK